MLNQITAFIDMGHEVEIVALQKGDTQHTHAARRSMAGGENPLVTG